MKVRGWNGASWGTMECRYFNLIAIKLELGMPCDLPFGGEERLVEIREIISSQKAPSA